MRKINSLDQGFIFITLTTSKNFHFIKNQFISVVFNTIHGIKIKFLKGHSKVKHLTLL